MASNSSKDQDPAPAPAPALKEIFNEACFQSVAATLRRLDPKFDGQRFLALCLSDLDGLSIMQRLRRMAGSLHATLPVSYSRQLLLLRRLAPEIGPSFVSLVLPEFVGQYGRKDFDRSMEALHFFTRFGSSEFGIRPFLHDDLERTLTVMTRWSLDPNEHVRRLASEGSRPRLPWSGHIGPLLRDPSPVVPILENLKTDPSKYVRKSVANHLNDISKLHPGWVIDRMGTWPRDLPPTAWIIKHALRTLIKKGDPAALTLIGAGAKPQLAVRHWSLSPGTIRLGGTIVLSAGLQSQSRQAQRLVVDYTIHYIKKSGTSSPKVFKWKELELLPGEIAELTRRQQIRDFTTRTHHAGRHRVELMINGIPQGVVAFDLLTD